MDIRRDPILSKRIIIAGGGTGGHIFPALAIAHALKEKDPAIELLFVGAKGKMEMQKIPEAGFRIEGIEIAGFNRSSLIKNIALPFKLIKSFFQVRKIIHSFKPDAVIGVGGYSSFPVLRYAESKGIPCFIHESNSFAGKSNKLLAKKAKRVFVATDGMEIFFPASKIKITGNPVRKTIVNSNVSREEALNFFGLDSNKRSVLVVGGSLGAKSINEAIDAGIQTLTENGLQLIWQTGKLYREKVSGKSALYQGLWINDFIDRMDCAFAAADIVVSRAGAMTIAELCVAGKAVIFIPYPYAAEDHQTANAMNLVSKKAGILIKDNEAAQKLVPVILDLVKDDQKIKELASNIKRLAISNADEQIAEEILKTIE